MGVEFRMRVTPETQDMSASVNSLQIASAIFNEREKRRAQVMYYIKHSEDSLIWVENFVILAF